MSNAPKGQSIAIIAYLTFVGTIIAFYMNSDHKYSFASWHIRNMFGLLIILFVSTIMGNYEIPIALYLWWFAFACWLWSLIMAILGKQQAIPFLSEKFQQWFRFLS